MGTVVLLLHPALHIKNMGDEEKDSAMNLNKTEVFCSILLRKMSPAKLQCYSNKTRFYKRIPVFLV